MQWTKYLTYCIVAGVIAGIAFGLIVTFIMEPLIRTAICYEQTDQPTCTIEEGMVLRADQELVAFAASPVIGLALGLLFALIYAGFHPYIPGRTTRTKALVLAYHARWEEEVAFDELETHQRPPRPLRSQTPVGVIQEVYGLLLAHYVVRAVMVDAAATGGLPPARLSFLSTLRIIRATLPEFHRTAPADHPRLYQQLLADVAATPLPPRRNRSNPRVVKRKMSNFGVKCPKHRRWPQPSKAFHDAIVIAK